MKTGLGIIISFTFILALSACATSPIENTSAEELVAKNQNLQQMTSERLKTVLDGNTVKWADGSHVYYSGSEIRSVESDGSPIVGTIKFVDNQHCRAWGGADKCSSVYEEKDGKLSFFVDGKPDSSGGYGYVIAGNPENL